MPEVGEDTDLGYSIGLGLRGRIVVLVGGAGWRSDVLDEADTELIGGPFEAEGNGHVYRYRIRPLDVLTVSRCESQHLQQWWGPHISEPFLIWRMNLLVAHLHAILILSHTTFTLCSSFTFVGPG